MELIAQLKHEHAGILKDLDKVKELGIATKEGQEKLFEAKSALLDHLRKEDARLYPPLEKEAENNMSLKKLLQAFARDMDCVTSAAQEFFDKYSRGGGEGLDFARDYGQLSGLISKRIRIEESILYKKFDELITR